jgi:hypothetical protein
MHEVRPFKSVFLPVDPDPFGGEARRELVGALDSVILRGLLDFLGFPPTTRSVRWTEDSGAYPLRQR